MNYAQIVEKLKLDKGIEFLVIFKYGDKYYRISNIEKYMILLIKLKNIKEAFYYKMDKK